MARRPKQIATSRQSRGSRANKASSTRKNQAQKQKSLESSRPRVRSQPKKKRSVAVGSVQTAGKKTVGDRAVVVNKKNTRRWNALPNQTQSFISYAMDEAAVSVESTLSASNRQQVSRFLTAIKISISDELRSVKAPAAQKTIKNYDQLPDLSAELRECLRSEEQRKNDINVATENLEGLIQQSEVQLSASRSGMKELHAAASQSIQTLQSEVQVQSRMGVASDRTSCSVADRLIGMLYNTG